MLRGTEDETERERQRRDESDETERDDGNLRTSSSIPCVPTPQVLFSLPSPTHTRAHKGEIKITCGSEKVN